MIIFTSITAQNSESLGTWLAFFVGRCAADTYWPEPIIPELAVVLIWHIPFSPYTFAL